jgi:chromatin remodeling complex protein RSC6
MPKPSTKKSTTEVVVSETIVSTPVINVAPVESKPKKAKTVKAEVAVAPKTEVAVAPKTEVVVVEEAAPVEVESATIDKSIDFLAKLNAMGNMISALKTEYRVLEKLWSKDLKAAQKLGSKRKRKAGNRAPSGFVKPTKISDELAKFLGMPFGSEMARTEVTRGINTYIRAQNLQDKDNGRKINPDAKLSALLSLKKSDELTYFNLQRYMSPHFAKSAAATAAAAAVAASVV